MDRSKVYFCRDLSPENVVNLYKKLGIELKGNNELGFGTREYELIECKF